MSRRTRRIMLWVLALVLVAPVLAMAAPEGHMTWALHFSLAPTLFEPAETPGVVSPFMILYALHDALVKPMPGKSMAPSLAESWSVTQVFEKVTEVIGNVMVQEEIHASPADICRATRTSISPR